MEPSDYRNDRQVTVLTVLWVMGIETQSLMFVQPAFIF